MISQKLLEQMIQKYGESKQLDIAIEECSELIKAISKYKRETDKENLKSRIASIAEEEADVRIMLEQIDIMMLKHDPEYTKKVNCEMLRKEQRIRNILLGIK
ncbi:MAG: hypothetical protein WCX79_01080 [Candidatus Paceibacterota bacterium]|jgi:NTP pyrophosphatase (non-canonical NTP hydrolase)